MEIGNYFAGQAILEHVLKISKSLAPEGSKEAVDAPGTELRPLARTGENRVVRLAYLVSHPIQYQAPLLRRVAKEPGIDLTVFFISDFSLGEYRDEGFGTSFKWDVPLLGGYRHQMLQTKGPSSPVTATRPWIRNLTPVLRAGRFDAIWLHGYSQITHLRAIAAARRLGIKVMIRAESQMTSAEGTGLTRSMKEAFIRRLFRKIDAFLAIGTLNQAYYEHYGVSPERIFQVPYAVDNAMFQSLASEADLDREKLRGDLGLEPGRPVILFASKLIPRKRAGDLIEAYARLLRVANEPHPYLVIVGDGEQRAMLEARARELGLAAVLFLGFKNQRELPAYLNLCDVFVLASEREPWGLIVNEAMNAGRPVIVTDEVGASSDLVEDGVNGFTIPARDVDALVNALSSITSNPEKAREMGRSGLERINTWDYDADVRGIKQALDYVLAGDRRL